MTRLALVTGASRGIGAAIAHALAQDGHRIAVHYRSDAARARQVVDALPGDGHVTVQGDLGAGQAEQVVTETVEQLGGLDVLVNNAGTYFHHPIATTGFAEWREAWRRTVELNLLGPAELTWHAAGHMTEGGRIINVGSRGAYRGEPDAPAYGAAKAGLHSMTQSLAQSLAPRGIAVAGVAPGFVRTEMVAELLDSAEGEAIRAQSPFGRVAEPEEVAAAVAFLASPAATWASGAIMDVNGASHLR
ncbi:NAD(P)-dependent dehydrogenase, short-chain alcohol dehydrogenase family [Lentzea xinjiangensis]|uniref:NAD(P)-dependent dehydrogenase, short-chain alcohol dehydrogenase family n=1 Tax=Lentzea xinjiangensis TaxID=402600 RepID=A0A1H9TXL8_9PSEU|nr:SDR family oxidoreductase [Lentzea xinjiangensis]SES01869.1 NAD(P)-dependent dehydrogenase, short-chain alcohol dehydrogenase family [Lentzea xinjiangensis]